MKINIPRIDNVISKPGVCQDYLSERKLIKEREAKEKAKEKK